MKEKEELVGQEPVNDDEFTTLEAEIFANISYIAFSRRLKTEDVAIALCACAEEMLLYLKSVGLFDDNKIEEIKKRATEFANEKQDKFENDGTMDRIREILEKARNKTNKLS